MKHLLLTTIAAVVLLGYGDTGGALAKAFWQGNIKAAKQGIDGADVNPMVDGWTHLYTAMKRTSYSQQSQPWLSPQAWGSKLDNLRTSSENTR